MELVNKIKNKGKMVEVDLNMPNYKMGRDDRAQMIVNANATKQLMNHLVSAKFKDGMGHGMDCKIWADWQEIIFEDTNNEENSNVYVIPMNQLEWILKIAKDENVKIMPGLAQWRGAFIDYCETLKPLSVNDNGSGEEK